MGFLHSVTSSFRSRALALGPARCVVIINQLNSRLLLQRGMKILDGDVPVSDAVRIPVHFIQDPAQARGVKALFVPQGAEEDDKRLYDPL